MAEVIINRPNFLASEVGLRLVSTTAKKNDTQAVVENGRKILKAGTVYPTNDASAEGIIFHDVDVTDEDKPASLMIGGYFYKDRVVGSLDGDAESAFTAKGLYGSNYPTTTRPY